jgi:hypothetical protein
MSGHQDAIIAAELHGQPAHGPGPLHNLRRHAGEVLAQRARGAGFIRIVAEHKIRRHHVDHLHQGAAGAAEQPQRIRPAPVLVPRRGEAAGQRHRPVIDDQI